MPSETWLSLIVGVGLAAACGFRVFVPLLVMSVAARAGHLDLTPGFAWIGSPAALVAFAAATAAELLGYFIPYVDHLLDLLGAPAAAAAGILVSVSSFVGMSPFLRWTLAIIAGGGLAALVHGATGAVRVASTVTTGGLGNPAVATVEAGGAVLLSVLAIAAPVVALGLLAALVLVVWRVLSRKRRKNPTSSPTGIRSA